MWLNAQEWSALLLSLKVAAWCVAVTALPGIAVGWLLARREFRGKIVLDTLVHLPLVLPPVVVGFLLLTALGRHGWLGWELAFTWPAAVAASAVMGFPLMVRAVRLGIEQVDERLESAARTLGASPWRVWLTVTLPLALPGVLTGAVLSFARSLGEFGATITVAGNIPGLTQTLPLAMYTYTQTPGGDAAAARLVVVSMALSIGALAASELLARRVGRMIGE